MQDLNPVKHVCIHGHFYQPPRENPWLESIEIQDSAYPFHDWNERITSECYGPNAAARILDHDDFVVALSNNYSRISFNLGPTLLSWMEAASPTVYESVLRSDRESAEWFSGHGSAIAQAYSHLIMPLANPRDRRTQVKWGVRDFESRFDRRPEGMWLPEAAVDTDSLEALVEEGILFTILAPGQARRYRRIGDPAWEDVTGDDIDTTRPYVCFLPSGRKIAIFFYDGAVSSEVAFNRLLDSGHRFANRLKDAALATPGDNGLFSIATDGESYGHHHRFGEMALASALDELEQNSDVRLTVYGEYLETHPPEFEVQVVELSSWSCVHGVERWRSNCGCRPNTHPDWNQEWRGPFRDAMDWLRDAANESFEQVAGDVFHDPWAARDGYIDVINDRSPESIDRFMAAHVSDRSNASRALKLMELQRHLMLCYTSCGWFFDEISDIEPLQVLAYAAHAIQLAAEVFSVDLEEPFLRILQSANSNVPEAGNGREIYLDRVKPDLVELRDVAAHSAVGIAFGIEGSVGRAFDVVVVDRAGFEVEDATLTVGRITVTSRETLDAGTFDFAVIRRGHGATGAVSSVGESTEPFYQQFITGEPNVEGLADYLESVPEADRCSLESLFTDARRRLLEELLGATTSGVETIYQLLHTEHSESAKRLAEVSRPAPEVFTFADTYFLNSLVRTELTTPDQRVDYVRIGELIEQAARSSVSLDAAGLGRQLEVSIDRMLSQLREKGPEPRLLEQLLSAVGLAQQGTLSVDLGNAQVQMFNIVRSDEFAGRLTAAAENRSEVGEQYRLLSGLLRVRTADTSH